MDASSSPSSVVPSLLAPVRLTALLYSRHALSVTVLPANDHPEFDVVSRLEEAKVEKAVEEAKRLEVRVLLLPSDGALGSYSPRKLIDEVLPVLGAMGVRLKSLASEEPGGVPFDSENGTYMAGFRSAIHWPRPVPRHWPRCRCGHKCTRATSRVLGHILRGDYGEEKPEERCSFVPCGCLRYEEENEAAMGRGGR